MKKSAVPVQTVKIFYWGAFNRGEHSESFLLLLAFSQGETRNSGGRVYVQSTPSKQISYVSGRLPGRKCCEYGRYLWHVACSTLYTDSAPASGVRILKKEGRR
jgi:hypothetical protein